MAIYHCSVKTISRNNGRSVVAAAAYRSAEKMTNNYDGVTHDYTKKSGVVHSEIMLPENAPDNFQDRNILWNEVEKVEKAKNSRLAREYELALPMELNLQGQIELVRSYVKTSFTEKGMCADICIHDNGSGNPHAHVLLTCRPINEDGAWGDRSKKVYLLDRNGEKVYDKAKKTYKCRTEKTTDWDETDFLVGCRERWAVSANEFLEMAGSEERIDHRSFIDQGITDLLPTIHLGPEAHSMEMRGIETRRGNYNRDIAEHNRIVSQIRELSEAVSEVQREKFEAPEPAVFNKEETHTVEAIKADEAPASISPEPQVEEPLTTALVSKSGANTTKPKGRTQVGKKPPANSNVTRIKKSLANLNAKIERLDEIRERIREILHGVKNKHGWVNSDNTIHDIQWKLEQTSWWNLVDKAKLNSQLETLRVELKELFGELRKDFGIKSTRNEGLEAVAEEARRMYGDYSSGKISAKQKQLHQERKHLRSDILRIENKDITNSVNDLTPNNIRREQNEPNTISHVKKKPTFEESLRKAKRKADAYNTQKARPSNLKRSKNELTQ